jgi:uncharacterized protein (DUF1501 family)
METFNILSRRAFLDRSVKIGLGVALATLADIPLIMKRALAEGTIGLNGKKLLFIFLRGANDSLNSVIPIQDSAYNADIYPTTGTVIRPNIAIPKDTLNAIDYSASGPCFDATQYSLDTSGLLVSRAAADATFSYNKAITLGNGFAALHPSLKFLAPVYNAGDLALVHRVAYPNQSRSHFDSQNYWESAAPNNKLVTEGIFYRTIIQSGLAHTAPLTGVSIQSALPYSLRGSAAAMTNLVDPTRYNLLGIPNTTAGNYKADKAIYASDQFPFPTKLDRELLNLQYKNLTDTLGIFAGLVPELSKTFLDDVNTDGDTAPYNLFPTTNAQNGGYALHGNDVNKYVVDTGAYNSSGTGFMNNLKAAALVLNKTDAIIAGTEFSGFDTHQTQGGLTGTHPNLQRRIGWAMYALRKYFLNNADKCTWDNLVVVTLSEFGRTTVQNGSAGTDHAEAGVMFIAGGAANGYNKGAPHAGVFGCSDADSYNGQSIPWVPGLSGSMFGASGRYLKRAVDYRSVLGKLIRDHLGATQNQLNQIIPGYADAGEHLAAGGTSSVDGVPIFGEPPIV